VTPAQPLPPLPPWYESAAVLLAEPDPGPTPFLVEGLFVDRAVGAIKGPPKVGKTWVILELAVSVVTGRPAFGRFEIPEPGPVLLILEESGRAALHRRLDALVRGCGIRPEALADLHVAANRGVRLNEVSWLERLKKAGEELEPRAIFLDPLARVKGAGVDENAQREIGPVLDSLRWLRDETGAAVGFAHHTPHEGGHLRGSSDIEATWESKLSITRNENGVCSITAEHREAESGTPFRYRLAFDQATASVRLELIEEPASAQRDFAAEIEAFLCDSPGAISEEVGAHIGKHRDFAKSILESDPRFKLVPPGAGRKANAKCWALSDLPVPMSQTGRDGLSRGNPSACLSRAPHTPEGGGGSDRQGGSRPASLSTQPAQASNAPEHSDEEHCRQCGAFMSGGPVWDGLCLGCAAEGTE
jgi:AAA domain